MNFTAMITKRLILVALLALSATGCQSFGGKSLTKLWPSEDASKKVTKSKFQQPSRMVVLWSPAMFNQPGAQPTRGFGGRIYFYNTKDEVIPVEGQLVVYGYNDTVAAPGKTTPDKTFVFRPEQLTKHFTPTQLGASYSVWVPWDAVGGEESEISLLPIFTSAEGQVCMGQQAQQNLPGKKVEKPAQPQVPAPFTQISAPGAPGAPFQVPASYPTNGQGGSGIAQASYQEPARPYGQQLSAADSLIHSSLGNQPGYPQTGLPANNNPAGANSSRVVETLSIELPSNTAQRLVGERASSIPETGYNGGYAPNGARMNAPANGSYNATPSAQDGASSARTDGQRFTVARNARSMGPVVPRARVVPSGPPVRSELPTPQAQASSALPQVPGQLPTQPLLGAQPSNLPLQR